MSSKNFLPFIISILIIAMTSSCKKEASFLNSHASSAPNLQESSGSSATWQAANESDRELKVMTYNMYSGAEVSAIWNSRSGAELAIEVGKAFTNVQGTAPERIEAIAHQIDIASPDIVGLQEAALWRVGPPLDPAPAETIASDFLEILLDRLAARGKYYSAISVQSHVDVELTAVFGTTPPLDVRYTDRSVIIARTDLQTSRFQIEGVNMGTYVTNTVVSLLGMQFTLPKGWVSADIKYRGKTYRFVATHMGGTYEAVNFAQANELLQGPINTTLPVILVGDFNTDAAAGTRSYSLLLNSGLADVWGILKPGESGFTWPLSADNPSVILNPSKRLDLIWTRGAISLSGINMIGEDVADLTPSGFRPSNHAGLVATLVLKP
jgi:endonuclease/exonuclease/phosphatase family metal-dependent hydrolase